MGPGAPLTPAPKAASSHSDASRCRASGARCALCRHAPPVRALRAAPRAPRTRSRPEARRRQHVFWPLRLRDAAGARCRQKGCRGGREGRGQDPQGRRAGAFAAAAAAPLFGSLWLRGFLAIFPTPADARAAAAVRKGAPVAGASPPPPQPPPRVVVRGGFSAPHAPRSPPRAPHIGIARPLARRLRSIGPRAAPLLRRRNRIARCPS